MRNIILAALLLLLSLMGCSKKESAKTKLSGAWKVCHETTAFDLNPGAENADSTKAARETYLVGDEVTVLEESGEWIKVSEKEFPSGTAWVKREHLFSEKTMKVLSKKWLQSMADTVQLKPGRIADGSSGGEVIIFGTEEKPDTVSGTPSQFYSNSFDAAVESALFLDTLRMVGNRKVSESQKATVRRKCSINYNDFNDRGEIFFGQQGTLSGDLLVKTYVTSSYAKGKSYTVIRANSYYWFKPQGGKSGYIAVDNVVPDSYLGYLKKNTDDLAFTGIVVNVSEGYESFIRPGYDTLAVATEDIGTDQADLLNSFCNTFVYHGSSPYNEEKRSPEDLKRFLNLLEEKNHPMKANVDSILEKMGSRETFAKIASEAVKERSDQFPDWYWLHVRYSFLKILDSTISIKGISVPGFLNHLWALSDSGDNYGVYNGKIWHFENKDFWDFIDSSFVPVDDSGNGLKEYSKFFDLNRDVLRDLFRTYNMLYENIDGSRAVDVVEEFGKWIIVNRVESRYFEELWAKAEQKAMNRYPELINPEGRNDYIGFLMRRSVDGSHYNIWHILTKLLWAYDREWFVQNSSPFGKPEPYAIDYDRGEPLVEGDHDYDNIREQFLRIAKYDHDDFFGREHYRVRNQNRVTANRLLDSLVSTKYYLAHTAESSEPRIDTTFPTLRFLQRVGLIDTLIIESGVDTIVSMNMTFRHSASGDTLKFCGADSTNDDRDHYKFVLYRDLKRDSLLCLEHKTAVRTKRKKYSGYTISYEKKKYWLIPEEKKDDFVIRKERGTEEQDFVPDQNF